MLQNYLNYLKDSLVIRRLLKEYNSINIRNLYWYDLPLHYAVSWRGIFRILLLNALVRKRDETTRNHGHVNLYWADTDVGTVFGPKPTVWHCRSLASKPWFDDQDRVKCLLEQSAATIAAEYENVRERVLAHPDSAAIATVGQWKGLFLYKASGEKNNDICVRCPATTRVIEDVPLCKNFGFALFSELEPKTHLTAHTGSSNLRLRYHLGIDIPEDEDIVIRVANEERRWEQGKCLVFDDSFEHEIDHRGQKTRVVLLVDIWHPALTETDIAFLSHPVFRTFGKVPS